jgi:hypothetical protein
MGRSSKDEAEEQQRNKHLQGDKTPGPQKTGHGVHPDQSGEPSEPPDENTGGRQHGSGKGAP